MNDENVTELEHKALKKAKEDPWRLKFHLMPVSGWLNDPNGLSEVDGVNHIFFQYLPQDTRFGSPNCWGHYSTEDFINYKYHHPAIFADHGFDRYGTHSGSAYEFENGLRAYYTGSVKHPGDFDYVNEGREQNLVLAEDFNPKTGKFESVQQLMSNLDYPQDLTLHVRDPKVFKKDNKYMMLLGARDKKDHGVVLIYESDDGYDWNYKRRIDSDGEIGYMWECPDLVTLDEKDFLIISPQGIKRRPDSFQNVFHSGYIPLSGFDLKPTLDQFVEFDKGFDFYAPQTYVDEKGRRILIGWMGLPDFDYEYPTRENGWIHALTVPRILTQKDGVLLQEPLPELGELRINEKKFKLNEKPFITEVPETFELILTDVAKKGLITIRNGCRFNWDEGNLRLSFVDDGEKQKKAGAGREQRVARVKELKRIRLFADTSSLEIFINDGEMVFTTRYFPEKNENELIVESDGSEATLYDLKAFKIENEAGEILFRK